MPFKTKLKTKSVLEIRPFFSSAPSKKGLAPWSPFYKFLFSDPLSHLKKYLLPAASKRPGTWDQEVSSISRQNVNENLENLHLSHTLFYHLPGFNVENRFFNCSSFVLDL